MPILALLLQAATPTAVTTIEAERLGVELARRGTLAALLPLIAAKETEELVAARPDLDAAAQAELRRTATSTYAIGAERLFVAAGREYAQRLTSDDMRALIAFYGTPAAARYQAVQPKVIAGTMASVGSMDFKADTLKAFCATTGKLCAAKGPTAK